MRVCRLALLMRKERNMKKEHNSSLDGLRWFAFLAVFLFHANVGRFHYGAYGVELFFVLSGFLIGRILLSLKEQTDLPLKQRLISFYVRRSLRIFPLFYFVVFLNWLLPLFGAMTSARQDALPYHAAYRTNFYLFFTGAKIDSQTHFWTLCVEEHFYLVSPLVLLLMPYRTLEKSFLALSIIVIAARLINFCYLHLDRFDYLSPMQFDVLCAGVAVAVIERRGSFLGVSKALLLRLGAWCGGIVLASALAGHFHFRWSGFIEAALFPTLLAIASGALILALWLNELPFLNRVLSRPLFVYLGSISYGLYIYHNFCFVISRHSVGLRHVLMTVAALLATIIIASLSWFLFERPINAMKRFFPYTDARPS